MTLLTHPTHTLPRSVLFMIDRSGLAIGDEIVRVNGQAVAAASLKRMLRDACGDLAGSTVQITFLRGGSDETCYVHITRDDLGLGGPATGTLIGTGAA